MDIKDLLPGTKVELTKYIADSEGEAGMEDAPSFYSSIYDIEEDASSLVIYAPISGGRVLAIPEDCDYEITFHMSKWLYRAQGHIERIPREGSMSLIRLYVETALTRIQRREYYRLECVIPAAFQVVDERIAAVATDDEMRSMLGLGQDMRIRGIATILDISGGGARLVSSSSLKDQRYIVLNFKLRRKEGFMDMSVLAELLRSSRLEDENKYIHNLRFMYKDPFSKERIVGYIFEEERRLRKMQMDVE